MTRYNDFAKSLDREMKAVFAVIEQTDHDLKRAEAVYAEAKGSHDERRILNGKANLMDCQAASKAARDDAMRTLDGLRAKRKDLEQAITDANTVDPEQVDAAGVELLKSGILTFADFDRLAGKYRDNSTMRRLIGKYARDAVGSARDSGDAVAASQYQQIVAWADDLAHGSGRLEGYDFLTSTAARCIDNHAMIGSWDMLTAETVAKF